MEVRRFFVLVGVITSLTIVLNASQPIRLTDDFSNYPSGSTGEPNWEVTHIGFEVRDGKFIAEVPAGRGYAVAVKAPLASSLTVEATVTVLKAIGVEWKIAGIGVFLDQKNYWHLALVESPEKDGRRHFAELHQMLDGVWLSDVQDPTRLTTEEDTGGFDWQFGQPYRLKLTLTKERVIGEIFDQTGALRYRCVRRLDNRAVTFGQPMLDCGGFLAVFDDVSVEVREVAPKREKPSKTYPPFVSRPFPNAPSPVKPTGFFRTQQINGVWWLIDPNGNPTLSIGTDHVSYYVHWCEKLGYAPYHRNVAKKYGSEEAWAKEAVKRLLSWNFNVLGANNSVMARYQGLAHTEFLAFGSDFASIADIVPKVHWTGFPDVFDPRFERFCDLRAKERAAPNRDDPWLLGYFLDNELEWWGKSGRPWGMAEEAWKKPADKACKKALVDILRRFYRNDIKAFNTDFGTNFSGFDELLNSQEPKQPVNERGQKALMEFVREAADRYFRITAQTLKKHDPNHLNLGCRFAWDAPEPAWEMAGKYCDVVTVNIYPRIDLDKGVVIGFEEHLRKRHELCKKPIIVTEWSFPALDAKDSEGRPLPCRHGAGMRVENQTQRARCYAIMQRTLFALPFVVGSHYFMWVDEPALGISSTFPEDSNYGLVNEADEPYPELTAMAAKVNFQVVALHAGATAELKVKAVRGKGDKVVVSIANEGKVAATFTLAVWLNGKRMERKLTLKPNTTQTIAFPIPPSRKSATYCFVTCDPDEEVPERNKADNSAELVLPPLEKPTVGEICAVVCNPTEKPLRSVTVTIPAGRKLQLLNEIVVKDASGKQVPSQANVKEGSVTVSLPELPSQSAVTLWISARSKRSQKQEVPFVVRHSKGGGYTVETQMMKFVKDEPDGDAFDRIYLRDTRQKPGSEWVEIGSFTPLIWQIVAGQNLWVRPDRVERFEVVEIGPARLVVDVIFVKEVKGDRGQVITEVGPGGKFEALRAEPQPFRCAYRFTFLPNQPFFMSQCLWVENKSKTRWQWRGYYHYSLSRIGGDATDDEVGGPGVPNYWLPFNSWRDPKLLVHYGIISPEEDERLSIYFWKDEGGGQHPDCYRRLDLVLEPGQRWQPKEPEPVVAVFAVFETNNGKPTKGISELAQTLRSWTKLKARVF